MPIFATRIEVSSSRPPNLPGQITRWPTVRRFSHSHRCLSHRIAIYRFDPEADNRRRYQMGQLVNCPFCVNRQYRRPSMVRRAPPNCPAQYEPCIWGLLASQSRGNLQGRRLRGCQSLHRPSLFALSRLSLRSSPLLQLREESLALLQPSLISTSAGGRSLITNERSGNTREAEGSDKIIFNF